MDKMSNPIKPDGTLPVGGVDYVMVSYDNFAGHGPYAYQMLRAPLDPACVFSLSKRDALLPPLKDKTDCRSSSKLLPQAALEYCVRQSLVYRTDTSEDLEQ